MDVRCPQCDTLYEIDARQLRGGAATLKCSQCDHVFRLQTQAALSRENQRRWMVKNTTSGDILYFSAFDQLHEWILKGKVDKVDQVSRTGKRWTRLEKIGEFRPIFQAVESISSISSSHGAAPRETQREGSQPGPVAEDSAPSSAPQPKPAASQPKPASPQASPKPNPQPAGQAPPNRRRPKVKTSPQFGAQSKSAPRPPAADSGEPSPPEPAHTPVDSPRASTPPPSRSGPSSNGNSRPKVRLQTGAFGGASRASSAQSAPDVDEDEQWSFGDGSTLGEVENSGLIESSAPVEYDGGARRWPVILVVALVLVAGGGAGVYMLRPDLLEAYLPTTSSENVVDIARSDEEAQDKEPKAAEASPDELVQDAVSAALVSATEANATKLGAVTDAARPKIFASVDHANEAATKAAEKPDPDEILAKAQRYLESGNPRRARQKFHLVLEVDRNNAEAITGLGWSLLALGSPGAASAQFRKALNYSPGFGNAYIGLGKAEREQGNHQAALEAYQDYLSRFPGGSKASIARYQAEKLKEMLGQ